MSSLWMLSFLLFCAFLSIILIFLSYLLGNKNPYSSKISSYECGFAAIDQPTHPFTMKFFSMGMMFLMFDLEMMYLMPWSLSASSLTLISQVIVCMFILFVVLGLIYEWSKGGLEWF